MKEPPRPSWHYAAIVLAAIACAIPWPFGNLATYALALGIVFGLLGVSPWPKEAKTVSKWLIQGAIVALGLRLDLRELARAASDGLALAIGTIVGAMVVGLLLARALKLTRDLGLLISSGTAICGGSAIAAVGSSIKAKSSDMAIATAIVFVLNAVGVVVLPIIGQRAGLSDVQFGTWAGVALHDMASVNAVAKDYHALGAATDAATMGVALDTANVVKLTRVVWIAPLALLSAVWIRRVDAGKAAVGDATNTSWRSVIPWFILWFLAACTLRTFVPTIAEWGSTIKLISSSAFQLALFLIGTGVSVSALKQAGWRAAVHAAVLWVVLAGVSFVVIAFASGAK